MIASDSGVSAASSIPHIVHHDANGQRDSRPRVLHLVEAFEKVGGPPVLVRQIVGSPLARKYAFSVVSYAVKGVSLKSVFKLRSIVRELSPAIVHVHGLKPDGFHSVLAARIEGARRVVTVVHSSTELSIAEYSSAASKLRRWLVCQVMETATLFLSHAVYTVCDHMHNHPRIRRWSGSRLAGTIHNCVDIPLVDETKEQIRARLGFSDDELLILFIGRICKNKGLLVLAEAMEQVARSGSVPGAKLVLVGSGSGTEFQQIKDRFAVLVAEKKAVFLGAREDVFCLNKMGDLFVLPSVFKENFSFALLEAAASGIAVVATNHGGNPELVNHGQTGLLVPPGDARALAEALQVLAQDEVLRRRLAAAGRERVRTDFPVIMMLGKTDALYEQLLAGRQASGHNLWSCG